MFKGYVLALIEIGIIFIGGYNLKRLKKYKNIDIITFYWLLFTTITGIWELSFLINYNETCKKATHLLENKEHVWTNDYSLFDLLPFKFSLLFYSEYGAYADREYMLEENNWSRIIEGTHLIFCGLGSFLALLTKQSIKQSIQETKNIKNDITIRNNKLDKYYLIFVASSMSSQAMNSILYMVNYFHQTRDPINPNYNTTDFPTGNILNARPFMYINIVWTVLPLCALLSIIYNPKKINKLTTEKKKLKKNSTELEKMIV